MYILLFFSRRIAHPSESINSGRDSELLLTSSGQGYLTSLRRTNLLLLLSILLSFLLLFHLSLLLSLLFSSASKEGGREGAGKTY